MIDSQPEKKKLLFVAMQTSIHTARWIKQISNDYDVHLFAVDRGAPHPELTSVTIHQPFFRGGWRDWMKQWIRPERPELELTSVVVKPRWNIFCPEKLLGMFCWLFRVRLGVDSNTTPFLFGPAMLAKVANKEQPDLIHSLEFQHCSYLVLEARRFVAVRECRWWATNWGSDVYYFRQFPDHKKTIERLFENLDLYSCECERDLELARELGFDGVEMPVLPNTGGFDLSEVQTLRGATPTSQRELILVKGYQAFVGRALTALESLELIADKLQDFRIVVYSACPPVSERVEALQQAKTLSIECSERMTHREMLKLFSSARVYLGVSLSDGISTSLLEAMAMGTFPIQTDTSCCKEWIVSGETGFEIPCDDVPMISSCVEKAILDDALVDDASQKNWKVVSERLDSRKISNEVAKMYRVALSDET